MKKYIFLFLWMLILLPWNNGNTQVVNIEGKRIHDDSVGWSGEIAGKVAALQNRDLLFNAEFRPRIQYKTKKHLYLWINEFNYSRSQVVYANAAMSHFRYAYRIKTGPWKWESYAQVQYNQLLQQKLRTLAGTGLRWKFHDKEKMKFFAGSSFYFEYEEIEPDIEFNSDVRWSNYISWFIVNKENVTFTAATYYQPNIRDFKDYRILGQYLLQFKLMKKVDIRMDYTTFYDTRPPANVRKWIFNSSIGFVYRLK